MTPSFASCDLGDAHKSDSSGDFQVVPTVFRDFGAVQKFCGPVVTVNGWAGVVIGFMRMKMAW